LETKINLILAQTRLTSSTQEIPTKDRKLKSVPLNASERNVEMTVVGDLVELALTERSVPKISVSVFPTCIRNAARGKRKPSAGLTLVGCRGTRLLIVPMGVMKDPAKPVPPNALTNSVGTMVAEGTAELARGAKTARQINASARKTIIRHAASMESVG
jgi:hypothetical protein